MKKTNTSYKVLIYHFSVTLDKGINLHQVVREYLDGHDDATDRLINGCDGYWQSIQPQLKKIECITAQELYVSHSKLKYKGFFDCIANFK